MNSKAPTLETARLRLRHAVINDFQPMTAMWADPIVYAHIGGVAFSAQQTWARLMACVGHWAVMNFGYWIVEDKVTGAFVGQVGFANHKRGIKEIQDMPELGWVVASSFHGKGIATEAVGAAIAWADNNLKSTVGCIISPENLASLKVAKKFDFKQISQIDHGGLPTLVFHRKKE